MNQKSYIDYIVYFRITGINISRKLILHGRGLGFSGCCELARLQPFKGNTGINTRKESLQLFLFLHIRGKKEKITFVNGLKPLPGLVIFSSGLFKNWIFAEMKKCPQTRIPPLLLRDFCRFWRCYCVIFADLHNTIAIKPSAGLPFSFCVIFADLYNAKHSNPNTDLGLLTALFLQVFQFWIWFNLCKIKRAVNI